MIIQDFLLKRKCIALMFLVAAFILATSAFLIYRDVYRPKSPNAILSKYGFLFKRQADMDVLNKLIRSQKPVAVEERHPPSTDTCKLSCPPETYLQQKQNNASNNTNTTDSYSSSNTTIEEDENIATYMKPKAEASRDDSEPNFVRHGCCRSIQEYKREYKLADYETGKWLHIVTYRKSHQFFLTDNCTHDKGCDRGCKCGKQMITALAVVVDYFPGLTSFRQNEYNDHVEKYARIGLVRYPGWCKCFND